jgi:hypothetical protein
MAERPLATFSEHAVTTEVHESPSALTGTAYCPIRYVIVANPRRPVTDHVQRPDLWQSYHPAM